MKSQGKEIRFSSESVHFTVQICVYEALTTAPETLSGVVCQSIADIESIMLILSRFGGSSHSKQDL